MKRALLLASVAAVAATAQDAREIVNEVQNRSKTDSQHYQGLLRVIDAKGKSSEKQWIYDRIGSHGTSKVVIRFTAPADVKGVALLVVNHAERSGDQWMWTPSINRERRIAVQDRRTRFFGTDFSFEDLEERDVEHDDYSLRGEEIINGEPCWKVEAKPKADRKSQYTRSTLWIRKGLFTYAQIDNYIEDKLTRRLKFEKLENIQGIWTARTLDMEDLTRNSHTVLRLDSLQYNVPMRDNQFTLEALRHL